VSTEFERLALADYLAGYRRLTREAYTLDLRQFVGWSRSRSLQLFSVRRADIETFARELEAKGRARATVTRRLCIIAGFYKYAVEEELLDHSPAAHVRRPRVDYGSHVTALDRNEVGALLVSAGLGTPAEHALISLLVLNGLRVSEATGANIEHLGLERGHRALMITRKGGKVVTIPLAPRTARAIDLAIGERTERPLFVAAVGKRLNRTAPPGSFAGSPAAPRSASRSARTRSDTRSSPPPSTPRSRSATCRRPPPTPTRGPPCATTGHGSASTGTPPTSSPPTSPEQQDSPGSWSGRRRRRPD
jgi:integrase